MNDEREKWWSHPKFSRILLAVAFVLTILCLGVGIYSGETNEEKVGAVATKRYVAPKDTVDVAETERQKETAKNSVATLYQLDKEVETTAIKELSGFFQELDKHLADEGDFFTGVKGESFSIPVVLTAEQCRIYATLTEESRLLFQKEVKQVLSAVYEQGVTGEKVEKTNELVETYFEKTAWSKTLRDMGKVILTADLKPNMIPDTEATVLAQERKMAEVADVVIKKNQKIVDQGEIITQQIYEKLVQCKLAGTGDSGERRKVLIGLILLVTLLFGTIAFYFSNPYRRKQLEKKEQAMLLTNYSMALVLLVLLQWVGIFPLLPISLFAMMVSLLIGSRLALLFHVFVSILGCLLFQGDGMALLYYLITGSFSAVILHFAQKRKYVFLVGVAVAAVHFFTYLSLGLLLEQGISKHLFLYGGYGGLVGFVSVIIAVGSLPFWEVSFEANTPFRLLELTNPTNPLLHRLMTEAPGTYHHSLIVANLAETASYDIGANPNLARAGSYFHDIGKLNAPLYFGENQNGENPHDAISPLESAEMIRRHPVDGMVLGKAHGLPKAILSMIVEHHGTSLVKYFYFKALKEEGNETVEEIDYRYVGPLPSSRESAIIMLADTVEAAVRSFLGSGKSLEEAEVFIHQLVRDKLEDGQLDHSQLLISDLEMIEKSFVKVFHGMYHNRISYPKPEELKQAKEEKLEKGQEEQK